MSSASGCSKPGSSHYVETEELWVGLQPLLLSRGYRLRPRYDPNWEPSWIAKPGEPKIDPERREDSIATGGRMIDGVRISDGQKVVFKRVLTSTEEIGVATFLSSPKLRADPRNTTVPILDVILIPANDTEALIVMPMLLPFHHLPFRRVGEFCEAALQLLQGLEFMHEHSIAHRDACRGNFMMDARRVVPRGWHFLAAYSHDGVDYDKYEWRDRWTVMPVRYYLIDFGLSTHCRDKQALVTGIASRDKSVPELSKTVPYNPFTVDIYQAGNLIKGIVEKYEGLEIFRDLAAKMTKSDPAERPSAAQALQLCKATIKKLNYFARRRRIWQIYDERKLVPIDVELMQFRITFCGANPVYY